MKITFNNRPATIRSEMIYCKAGAYEHKYRRGWVVEQDGKLVFGNRSVRGTVHSMNDRHDYPEFRTRSDLVAYLEEESNAFGFKRTA